MAARTRKKKKKKSGRLLMTGGALTTAVGARGVSNTLKNTSKANWSREMSYAALRTKNNPNLSRRGKKKGAKVIQRIAGMRKRARGYGLGLGAVMGAGGLAMLHKGYKRYKKKR